jgi:hypothetical protein
VHGWSTAAKLVGGDIEIPEGGSGGRGGKAAGGGGEKKPRAKKEKSEAKAKIKGNIGAFFNKADAEEEEVDEEDDE